MPQTKNNDAVATYIEGLPDWSKTICLTLQRIVMAADPLITEEWKWGPHYSANGMVCGFGAFQRHVKLTFFNGSQMKDAEGLFNHCTNNQFSRSIKIINANEIDEKTLTTYVKEALLINRQGFKRVAAHKQIDVPENLQQELNKNKTAAAFFKTLSYSYKKEFVEWVTAAKQEKTKVERIAKVVALAAAEKKLNDKYKHTI